MSWKKTCGSWCERRCRGQVKIKAMIKWPKGEENKIIMIIMVWAIHHTFDRPHLLDAPEHIISDVTWGLQVFHVFQHACSPRRPRFGCSDQLGAGGNCDSPWTSSLHPEPSWSFLCFHCVVLHGSSPFNSCALKFLYSDCPAKPVPPTSMNRHLNFRSCFWQVFILSLSLMGLLHAVLPWQHELHQDDVSGLLDMLRFMFCSLSLSLLVCAG